MTYVDKIPGYGLGHSYNCDGLRLLICIPKVSIALELLNKLKFKKNLRFVDINGIDEHHCLYSLSSQCCVPIGEATTTTFIV
jgi:hypothetical protein